MHFPAPPFDATVATVIACLALVMASLTGVAVVHHAGFSRTRATLACLAWLLLPALVAASGTLARADLRPLPAAAMIPFVLIVGAGLGRSRTAERLAASAPLWTLVIVQSFRLPLELAMHRAATLHIMPIELSFSGYNFDIVTGLSALVLGVALRLRPNLSRTLVWAWNFLGIGCLAAIVAIAVASSPMLRAFGDAPAHVNTWVLTFPYVWLPTVLVVVAIAGHVVVTRALLEARHAARPG